MKDKQYLKEHEAEALKKIAEALGYKPARNRFGYPCISSGAFDPRKNAEQWIECLMWYIDKVWDQQGSMHACHRKIAQSVDTREALLVAILKMIGGCDERNI